MQASITSAVAFGLLGLDTAGPIWAVVLIAVAERAPRDGARLPERLRDDGVPGRAVHARGRDPPDPPLRACSSRASRWQSRFEWLSNLLPLTYAYDALAQVTASGEIDGTC